MVFETTSIREMFQNSLAKAMSIHKVTLPSSFVYSVSEHCVFRIDENEQT